MKTVFGLISDLERWSHWAKSCAQIEFPKRLAVSQYISSHTFTSSLSRLSHSLLSLLKEKTTQKRKQSEEREQNTEMQRRRLRPSTLSRLRLLLTCAVTTIGLAALLAVHVAPSGLVPAFVPQAFRFQKVRFIFYFFNFIFFVKRRYFLCCFFGKRVDVDSNCSF